MRFDMAKMRSARGGPALKHIVFVIHNLRIGGVQQSLVSLLHELAIGHRVTLVILDAENVAYELPPSVEIWKPGGLARLLGSAQADLRRFSTTWFAGAFFRILTRMGMPSLAYALALFGSRRRPRADVAVSYMHPSARRTFQGGTVEYVLRNLPAGRRLCFIHADVISAGLATGRNARLLRRYDVVAAVSQGVADRVCQAFPEVAEKVRVVPNGVRKDLLSAQDIHKYSRHQGGFTVATVARLQSEKRVDRGLLAVAHCLEAGMSVNYLIVGDGRERANLENQAMDLGIQRSVDFLGEVDNPAEIIASADLLLVTSDHEAAPLVFDEARALGTRVVTTNTLSAREKVERVGNGVVVEDESEFATAVMRELGRAYQIESWTPRKVHAHNARVAQIFLDVVAND